MTELMNHLNYDNARSVNVLVNLCHQREWAIEHFGMSRDSCILSTRVVLEVSRYFGLPHARPVPVSAAVFNGPGFERYQEWHALPPEERPGIPLDLGEDGYAVGIDGDDLDTITPRGPAGGRWNGHLIAQVGDLLCDWSLDQFNRPERGMPTNASVFPVDQIWNQHGVSIHRRKEDGSAVVYRSMGNARGYTRAPDWRAPRIKRLIGPIINRLKEEL